MSRTTALAAALLAACCTAQAGVIAESDNEAGGKLTATDERNASCKADEWLFIATASTGKFLAGCWSVQTGYNFMVVRYFLGSTETRFYDMDGFREGAALVEYRRTHPKNNAGTVY